MADYSSWLPDLIRLEDFNGNWHNYIESVFAIFYRDFIESQPKFENKWVRCRRDPMDDGKEAGFWHCTSQGPEEPNRNPELRRCERIGWVRAVIEHSGANGVLIWKAKKGSETRVKLWLEYQYIVILGVRKKNFQLITAYCTDRKHTREKLKKEYEKFKTSEAAL